MRLEGKCCKQAQLAGEDMLPGCKTIARHFSAARHFAEEIIVLCVRWYLRSLSYRDLEELITERCLSVDHTTVWRWVQRYAPITPILR
jgi:transposase-like protein